MGFSWRKGGGGCAPALTPILDFVRLTEWILPWASCKQTETEFHASMAVGKSTLMNILAQLDTNCEGNVTLVRLDEHG